MTIHLQKWFRKRNWRRTFHVHFIMFEPYELDAYLQQLGQKHKLRVLNSEQQTKRSIEIRARPKQLHEALRTLPTSVGVFYEEKEPKKH